MDTGCVSLYSGEYEKIGQIFVTNSVEYIAGLYHDITNAFCGSIVPCFKVNACIETLLCNERQSWERFGKKCRMWPIAILGFRISFGCQCWSYLLKGSLNFVIKFNYRQFMRQLCTYKLLCMYCTCIMKQRCLMKRQ